MDNETESLSQKALTILEQIAEGRTYEQILSQHPDLTYLDIFAAAREVLTTLRPPPNRLHPSLERIKRRHPRAYERWTPDEDARLSRLAQTGADVAAIARDLQRQRSAIRSRMGKLGLLGDSCTADGGASLSDQKVSEGGN